MVRFNTYPENQRMDCSLTRSQLQSLFKESSVEIVVLSGACTTPPQSFCIPGFLHRKLTTIIEEAFHDRLAHLLHYSPFKLFYQVADGGQNQPSAVRIYGEIYSSDTFIDEYEYVQLHGELPLDDLYCKRERTIVALMFASDATCLANFGSAKAWRIYLMLGNLSKYT